MNFRKIFKIIFVVSGLFCIGCLLLTLIINLYMLSYTKDYIYYEDKYYVSITDDREKCDLVDERVQGNWIEHGYVRGEKTQFPYLHYWVPGHFLDELLVSEDEEYLYIHVWAGIDSYSEVYQRVEE